MCVCVTNQSLVQRDEEGESIINLRMDYMELEQNAGARVEHPLTLCFAINFYWVKSSILASCMGRVNNSCLLLHQSESR